MFATPATPVTLTVPADPSFVRIVRLIVSSLAADLDFDVDEIEDLRIAADELLSTLITGASVGAPVRVSFANEGGVLELRASAQAARPGPIALDPLASHIVAALVDSFDLNYSESTITAGFRSRRGERQVVTAEGSPDRSERDGTSNCSPGPLNDLVPDPMPCPSRPPQRAPLVPSPPQLPA